jgi:hypothetical protein
MIHTIILRNKTLYCQGLAAVFCLAALFGGCTPKRDIALPAVPPLSRSVLGYAVVNASYCQVMDEPSKDGVTLGYVRESTILTVLERRLIKDEETLQYWVLTEGTYYGWLPQESLVVYDTQEKAQTAASSRK